MKKDNFSAMVEEYLAELGPRGRAMALAGLLGVSSLGLMGCPNPTTIEDEATVTGISVSDQIYYVGQDYSKPTVTATLDNDTTTDVTSYCTFSFKKDDGTAVDSIDTSSTGNYTVTVSYAGFTADFDITVKELTMTLVNKIPYTITISGDGIVSPTEIGTNDDDKTLSSAMFIVGKSITIALKNLDFEPISYTISSADNEVTKNIYFNDDETKLILK